jgi:putative transposase
VSAWKKSAARMDGIGLPGQELTPGLPGSPDRAWVTQQARNLRMHLEDRADGLKFLIRDRDAKFTAAFDAVFTAAGVRIIKTPVQAPG